jgi:hypothetical protein
MSELQFNCTDIELLLCDYVDGVLPREQTAAFEQHLPNCPACAEMVRDSKATIGFIERCATVEPPPQLLTRIMHELPVAQKESKKRGWLGRLLEPILQPRFAMGMAMTILSFSMLGKFVGPVKPIKPEDLNPMSVVATVDNKIHRLWNNAVKYYENLRLVYEIQSRLREWNQEEEQERRNQQQQTPPDASREGNK